MIRTYDLIVYSISYFLIVILLIYLGTNWIFQDRVWLVSWNINSFMGSKFSEHVLHQQLTAWLIENDSKREHSERERWSQTSNRVREDIKVNVEGCERGSVGVQLTTRQFRPYLCDIETKYRRGSGVQWSIPKRSLTLNDMRWGWGPTR